MLKNWKNLFATNTLVSGGTSSPGLYNCMMPSPYPSYKMAEFFLCDLIPHLLCCNIQLYQVAWRFISSINTLLQCVPHVFNRIQVWTLRRPVHSGYLEFFKITPNGCCSAQTDIGIHKKKIFTDKRVKWYHTRMFFYNVGYVPVSS